jgi:hypothetical protein
MLNFAFETPSLIVFEDRLQTDPDAPITNLFELLIEAIGEKGLKPTATGNLPRNFCRAAALSHWGPTTYAERTEYGGINQEPDFLELHVTRLTAELAGLIRKYKGRFILSSECRRLLKLDGLRAIYPVLFRAYVRSFNWGYWDGYPDLRLLQSAFPFTLYLLKRQGASVKEHTFYEAAFLRAFPAITDDVPKGSFLYTTPEKIVRDAYTWRTLLHFTAFFGLAEVKPKTDDFLCHEFNVKALPLLDQVVQFKMDI